MEETTLWKQGSGENSKEHGDALGLEPIFTCVSFIPGGCVLA